MREHLRFHMDVHQHNRQKMGPPISGNNYPWFMTELLPRPVHLTVQNAQGEIPEKAPWAVLHTSVCDRITRIA